VGAWPWGTNREQTRFVDDLARFTDNLETMLRRDETIGKSGGGCLKETERGGCNCLKTLTKKPLAWFWGGGIGLLSLMDRAMGW
jgi:hypothetical protein